MNNYIQVILIDSIQYQNKKKKKIRRFFEASRYIVKIFKELYHAGHFQLNCLQLDN